MHGRQGPLWELLVWQRGVQINIISVFFLHLHSINCGYLLRRRACTTCVRGPFQAVLQLGCQEPGADLSGAGFRRVARGAGDAAITTPEACATAGGTWDFETNTALTGKDTTAPACLTAQGVLFGTRFPTAGYAQYGASHDCVCDYN